MDDRKTLDFSAQDSQSFRDADPLNFDFSAEDRATHIHTEELNDFIFEGGVFPPVLRKQLLFALEHSDVTDLPILQYPSAPLDARGVGGSDPAARALFHAEILLRLLRGGHPIPAKTRKYLIDSLRRMERNEIIKKGVLQEKSRQSQIETLNVDWGGHAVKDVSLENPVAVPLVKRKYR